METMIAIATLEKELMLTTSAIRNLRNMMKRSEGLCYDTKKHRWPKAMRAEAAILRNRVDSMLGTLTILLSMAASSSDESGIKISADDSKKALAACAIEDVEEFNLEASLSTFDGMAVEFVSDICHGDNVVDWQRCAKYIQSSLRLSTMLSMD